MALLPGSPAIGNGVAADYPGTNTPITTDQRGAPRGSVVDIGAFQATLVVESTSGSVDTSATGLTLPGAVVLAKQFAGSAISFDPAIFSTPQTITLGAVLELSATVLSTTITGPAADVTVSGGDAVRVFLVDSGRDGHAHRPDDLGRLDDRQWRRPVQCRHGQPHRLHHQRQHRRERRRHLHRPRPARPR